LEQALLAFVGHPELCDVSLILRQITSDALTLINFLTVDHTSPVVIVLLGLLDFDKIEVLLGLACSTQHFFSERKTVVYQIQHAFPLRSFMHRLPHVVEMLGQRVPFWPLCLKRLIGL